MHVTLVGSSVGSIWRDIITNSLDLQIVNPAQIGALVSLIFYHFYSGKPFSALLLCWIRKTSIGPTVNVFGHL